MAIIIKYDQETGIYSARLAREDFFASTESNNLYEAINELESKFDQLERRSSEEIVRAQEITPKRRNVVVNRNDLVAIAT